MGSKKLRQKLKQHLPSLFHRLNFPPSLFLPFPSPAWCGAGKGTGGCGQSVMIPSCRSFLLTLSPSPAWVLPRPQFLQGISTHSGVGSSTGYREYLLQHLQGLFPSFHGLGVRRAVPHMRLPTTPRSLSSVFLNFLNPSTERLPTLG